MLLEHNVQRDRTSLQRSRLIVSETVWNFSIARSM